MYLQSKRRLKNGFVKRGRKFKATKDIKIRKNKQAYPAL